MAETKTEQKQQKETRTAIFGVLPQNTIINPNPSYNLRNDCQVGQWKFGDSDYKGSELEMALLKASKFYGSLGETKKTNWLQVWFIAAPSETKISQNLVCCTYIKTKSLDLLGGKLIELMQNQIDPGLQIWKASFVQNKGKYGTYYNLSWSHRDRKGEAEEEQLNLICDFIPTASFRDTSKPKTLLCVDNLSPEEIEELDSVIDALEADQEVEIPDKVKQPSKQLAPAKAK